MMRLLLISILLAWHSQATYLCSRPLTLGKATNTDQANFPVLLKFDFSNVGTTFKTAANGGKMQNTVTQSGGAPLTMPADFAIGTDSACTSLIPWEFETYSATAGTALVWTRPASLTTATNTALYTCYNSTATTTQQNAGSFSVANVWSASFAAVWHLPDATTLTTEDSTSGAKTLTNNATVTPVAGQIDGAAHSTVTAWLSANDSGLPTVQGPFTISGWYNTTTSSTSNIIVNWGGGAGDPSQAYMGIYNLGNGFNAAILGNGLSNLGDNVNLNDGVWHYIVGVVTNNSTNGTKIYVDGALKVTGTLTWVITLGGAGQLTLGRAHELTSVQPFIGDNDEVQISSTDRPADWIATAYANQLAPLSFNTVGAETCSAPPASAVRHKTIGQ